VTLPAGFELTVEHHPAADVATIATRYLELLASFRAGTLAGWWVGQHAEGADPDRLLGALRDAAPDERSFTLETEAGAAVTVTVGDDAWTAHCRPPAGEDEQALAGWLAGCMDVTRALLGDDGVVTAALSRAPAWARFVPAPPLARWNHAVLIDEAAVAADYLRPERFWSCWPGQERHGERRLLLRAMDAVHEEDWVDAVLADQLELARAARPALTRWYQPGAEDWDSPGLAAPEHRLEVVGYLPDEQVFELAGYFAPEEHVPLVDLLTILAMTQAGRTADGHPLRAVRVVFPDRDMAEREAVPLLDVGAEVWYLDEAGERERLEPPDG
jgi:hypothetical protein